VDFDSVTVKCNTANSYVKKVSGQFKHCVFEGRTTDYGVFLTSATCNPAFTCCQFQNMAPISGSYMTTVFSATGCNPSFGTGNPVEPNTFSDTSGYLLTIQGTGLLPVINKRGNNFYQHDASGRFMEWRECPINPTLFSIQGQYWEPTPSIALFTPSMASYWRYSPYRVSLAGPCEAGGLLTDPGPVAGRDRTLDEDSLAMDTLDYAIQLEVEEDFAAAQAIYLHLVRTTEDWQVRWQAATRLVTTEVHLENGGQWLENLIDSLIAVEDSSYDGPVLGHRLLANYHLNHAEYQPAIDICLDVLESGLLFHDSIAVAMELVGIQMAAGVQEGEGGGLDENRWARIPDGLRIKSFTHGMEVEKKLLHLLGSGGHQIPEPREIVPTAFQLYQNHPNPFNPTTEIRFDLPEALRVELKVFNTLGQLVATLADETRPAGAYRILWDSKNTAGIPMASGVYVYQLKAGNFTDAKKMVLIR
ncbi:MAG: FlgD immunoglobulin-like domain containing protein, partial [bacterium]|nr:FlgD immunoglobulin-like domain containing protein [bacterium]